MNELPGSSADPIHRFRHGVASDPTVRLRKLDEFDRSAFVSSAHDRARTDRPRPP
jgi:hypothetical protein